MEKFSKFRDEATGVAPFLPVKHAQPPSLVSRVALFFVALLTLPIVLVLFLSYALVLQWLPGVSTWSLVLALKTLRLLYINFSYDGQKRVSARRCQQFRAKAGDVIVSNFVSPLDALVYAAQQATVFVFPTADGQFAAAGLLAAMTQALAPGPFAQTGGDLGGILAKAKAQGAVAVLFVEGTTSNGRGLLTTKKTAVDELAAAAGACNVFPAAIRYTPAIVTSPLPQTFLGYFWHLLSESWWYMCSVRLGSEPLRSESMAQEGVPRAICSVGRLRQLGDRLDWDAKQDFIKAYNEKRS